MSDLIDTTTPHSPVSNQPSDADAHSPWELTALSPELGDLTIPVSTSLRIGRQDNNDIVLASPRVSRQHAKLTCLDNQLYVQDLGSANGTFVNGERITQEAVKLQVGDEVAFDTLAFVVMPIDTGSGETSVDEAQLVNILTMPSAGVANTTANQDVPTRNNAATAIPTEPPVLAPVTTMEQPVTPIVTVENHPIVQLIPQPAVQSTITTGVTQPATSTTETPTATNRAKNMTLIAVTLIVIIALAIIASLFLS